MVLQHQRRHGHHHAHDPPGHAAAQEGRPAGVAAQHAPHPAAAGLPRLGPVARVVQLQLRGDVARVRVHPHHHRQRRQDYRRHQKPGGDHRVGVQASGDALGEAHQRRAAQRPYHGGRQHQAQALRPTVGRVHVGGCHPELLRGAHAQAEQEHAQDEGGEGADGHGQGDDPCPGHPQQQPQHQPRPSAVGVHYPAQGVGHYQAAHGQDGHAQAGQPGRAQQPHHHDGAQCGHHLVADTHQGLGGAQQQGVAQDDGRYPIARVRLQHGHSPGDGYAHYI
ncbi:hypothetical protein HRbin24_01949 [bacterium HR24]|nr:hypothetical protein HRbin24_01949 [bacterium HR24]